MSIGTNTANSIHEAIFLFLFTFTAAKVRISVQNTKKMAFFLHFLLMSFGFLFVLYYLCTIKKLIYDKIIII